MTQRAFVDSNVLASRTLRDWLFLLRNAAPGMFELHASLDVVVEAARASRRRYPTADGSLIDGVVGHLERNLNEVWRDFSGAVAFDGADADDHHVHAAALASGASYLVTDNPQDFGDPDGLPYEICTADDFLCLVDDAAPERVREVTGKQVVYWTGRRGAGDRVKPIDVALIDAGCSTFAQRVHRHLAFLSGLRTPPSSESGPSVF